MKQLIKNYTFNTSAKTITLTDFNATTPAALDRLQLIVDVTTNEILYNFASATIATATVTSNNVITLSALPADVANGDKLQVYYNTLDSNPIDYQSPTLMGIWDDGGGGQTKTAFVYSAHSVGDAYGGASLPIFAPMAFNGTNYDRVRNTTAANGAANPLSSMQIGLVDSLNHTQFVYAVGALGDAYGGMNALSVGSILFNGTNYDRARAGNLTSLATLTAWDNTTALNTTQTIFSSAGYACALVQVNQTTTLTGGAITFEITYDGTNWVTVPAANVLDPAASYSQISLPYTLQASTKKPFLLNTLGAQGLRIKLSTVISGSGTVTPFYSLFNTSPVVVASEPYQGAIGASVPSNAVYMGINDSGALKYIYSGNSLGDANNAADSASVAPMLYNGSSWDRQRSGNTTNLTTLAVWNSSTALNATQNIFTNAGYASVAVQLVQTTTLTVGAVTFEVTYDGTNWITLPSNNVLDPTSAILARLTLPYTLQASTNKSFLLNTGGAQGLRIKLSTAITGSGTVTPYYALLNSSPFRQTLAYMGIDDNDTSIQSLYSAQSLGDGYSGAKMITVGNEVYNGSSWDRLRGDTTNGAWVNVKTGAVTANAGTNLNTSALALETGGNLATLAGIVSSAKAAVKMADGDSVTLGAKADAKNTATDTTAISVVSVLKQISASVQAPPSQAVTNAGTFAVQAAEADGANVTLGSKADAKSTATDTTAVTIMQVLKEISAMEQAPASRAVTNAGTFAVQATLAAETTKVIGTVRSVGNVGAAFDAATNAAPPANAIQVGGVAATALPTAYTATDLAPPMLDKFGRIVTSPFTVRDLLGDQTTSITSTTAATTIVTADVSNMLDIISLTLTNTSATGTEVSLYNDDGTTLRWTGYVPANDMRGIVFPAPFKQTAVNKTWKMITVTSVASLKVTVQYVKNQ